MTVTASLPRPLNLVELKEALKSQKGPTNFSLIAHYKGSLNEGLLRPALSRLQDAHPLLGCCIKVEGVSGLFFSHPKPPSLVVVDRTDPSCWEGEFKRSIHEKFSTEEGPLWKTSLIQGVIEGEIILTFHHAIADALAATRLINELFQAIIVPTPLRMDRGVPDFKAFLSDKPTPTTTLPDHGSSFIISEGLSTGYVHKTLSKDTTCKLIKKCHAIGSTIQGALCAVVARALAEHHSHDAASVSIKGISIVNLRRYFTPPVPYEELAALHSGIATDLKVSPDDNLEGLSKVITADIHEQLEKGLPLKNLGYTQELLSRFPTLDAFTSACQAKDLAPCFIVSNIGKIPFDGLYDHLSLDSLRFASVMHVYCPLPNYWVVTAGTYRDQLFFTFEYTAPHLSPEEAEMIGARLAILLTDYSCD